MQKRDCACLPAMNTFDATGSLLQTDAWMAQLPQETPSSSPLSSSSHYTLSSSSSLDTWFASLFRNVQTDNSFELMELDGDQESTYLSETVMVPIFLVPSKAAPPKAPFQSSSSLPPPTGSGSESSQKAPKRTNKSAPSTKAKTTKVARLHDMDLRKVPQEQQNRVIRAKRCKTYRDGLKTKGKCPICLMYCKENVAFFEFLKRLRLWK